MSRDTVPYWRLSGFYFFYFAYLSALGPYWSLYLDSLGFVAAQIGVLMSLGQIMRIFAPHLWGWLADRARRPLLIAQLGAAAGLASYLGAFGGASFAWLFAVMSLQSFFWSATLPIVEATTLTHLRSRTERYGRIRVWGSVGFIFGVVGIGYLLDFVSIRWLLWVIALLMAGTVLMCRVIPEARIEAHERDQVALWRILRDPAVLALLGASFLMAVAHGPYYTFFSLYLVEHGYSKSAVGWLWAVGVIAEIGVFLWMPRLFAAFSLKRILGVSFALAGLRFSIIGALVDSAALMFCAQLMHAATFGSHHAAALAAVHRFFPGRHQARGQALYASFAFGAGGAVGGLYSGYAWEALGPGATFGIAAACAFAGMWLVWWKLRFDGR